MSIAALSIPPAAARCIFDHCVLPRSRHADAVAPTCARSAYSRRILSSRKAGTRVRPWSFVRLLGRQATGVWRCLLGPYAPIQVHRAEPAGMGGHIAILLSEYPAGGMTLARNAAKAGLESKRG